MRHVAARRGSITRTSAVLAVSVLLAIAIPAVVRAQEVSASPSSAPAGGTVTVSGTNFLPGEPVTIMFGGNNLGTAVADDAGNFSLSVRIPDTMPVGSHPMDFEGLEGSSAGMFFEVTEAVVAPPTRPPTVVPTPPPPVSAPTATPVVPVATEPASAPTVAPPAVVATATPIPAVSVPIEPVADGGLNTPLVIIGLIALLLLLLLIFLFRRRVVVPIGGPTTTTRPPQPAGTRPRDRSWIRELPPIMTGLPPRIYGEDIEAHEWALFLHDGEKWLPLRRPKGGTDQLKTGGMQEIKQATYEFYVRLVSDCRYEADPGVVKRSMFSAGSDGDIQTQDQVVSGDLIGGTDYSKAKERTTFRMVGARVGEVMSTVEVVAATKFVSDDNIDGVARVTGTTVKRARGILDDVTRVEIAVRSLAGEAERTHFDAHGTSWIARHEWLRYFDSSAAAQDLGKANTLLASAEMSASVESGLSYSADRVIKDAMPQQGRGSSAGAIAYGVAQGIMGEFPGGSTMQSLLGLVGSGSSHEIVEGGEQRIGEGTGEHVGSQFSFEIVNSGHAGVAIQAEGSNAHVLRGQADTRALHHITVHVRYDGPINAWMSSWPEFVLEIGEPISSTRGPAGNEAIAPPTDWRYDAKITADEDEHHLVRQKLPGGTPDIVVYPTRTWWFPLPVPAPTFTKEPVGAAGD